MNEQIDERLSSLMDGELERDGVRFLLRSAAADPARWERYHVARQVLRRQELVALRPGFADAVMAALADEPAMHARGPNRWLRWGAGGAIAASVAVFALVATRPAPTGPGDAPVALRAPATVQGAAIAASPASATSMLGATPDVRPPLLMPSGPVDALPASFGAEAGQTIVLDPRLQSYLVRHYQAVGGNGSSGFTPYVLLTSPQPAADGASAAGPATARKR